MLKFKLAALSPAHCVVYYGSIAMILASTDFFDLISFINQIVLNNIYTHNFLRGEKLFKFRFPRMQNFPFTYDVC